MEGGKEKEGVTIVVKQNIGDRAGRRKEKKKTITDQSGGRKVTQTGGGGRNKMWYSTYGSTVESRYVERSDISTSICVLLYCSIGTPSSGQRAITTAGAEEGGGKRGGGEIMLMVVMPPSASLSLSLSQHPPLLSPPLPSASE